MAALGLVNAKCGFGFDLYLAKIGVSAPDRAMELLYESAERLSKRFNVVSDLSGERRKELSKLYALLHTRITRAVQPVRGCANAGGTGFVGLRYLRIKSHTHGVRHHTGRRCPALFAEATGRVGIACVKRSRLNALPVTERVLSAIRAAVMERVRCWIN
jgi:hypothetical protein